jgi:hypothetical protein
MRPFARYAALLGVAVFVVLAALPAIAFAATPHKVTGLKVAVTARTATLTWSKASHATAYYVQRRTYDSRTRTYGAWGDTHRGSTTKRSYRYGSLAIGGRYQFRVRAKNTRYGSYSGVATKTLLAVDALAIKTSSFVNGSLSLGWYACAGATRGYRVLATAYDAVEGTSTSLVETTTVATAFDAYGMVSPFDGRDITITVTPLGAKSNGAPYSWGPGGSELESKVFVGGLIDSTPAPGTSDSVVRFMNADLEVEVTATVMPETCFMIDGTSADEFGAAYTSQDFFAAVEASPTAAITWEVFPVKSAGGAVRNILASANVAVIPAAPVVLPETVDGVSAVWDAGFVGADVFIFPAEDGAEYYAVADGETLFTSGDPATVGDFRAYLETDGETWVIWSLEKLATPLEIDGDTVSYRIVSADF